MKGKLIISLLLTLFSMEIVYGQNKTDFQYVKLDSVEFIHKPIFEEIQRNVIPFLKSKKYDTKKYMVIASFNLYSKKYDNLIFSNISIIDNRDFCCIQDFDDYLGYCKICDFTFIIMGKQAHLYAKDKTCSYKYIKYYSKPYSLDGCVSWMYFIKGEQIKLFKHIENW